MLYPPRVALMSQSPNATTGVAWIILGSYLIPPAQCLWQVLSTSILLASIWITYFPQILSKYLNWPFQHHHRPTTHQWFAVYHTAWYFPEITLWIAISTIPFLFSFLFWEHINHYHYWIDCNLPVLAMIHWASSSNSLSLSSTSSLQFLLQEFFKDQIGYILACSPGF